ncbi:hypothetical protein I4I73_19065, partial [Pseudonocardia sp. KRD-184]
AALAVGGVLLGRGFGGGTPVTTTTASTPQTAPPTTTGTTTAAPDTAVALAAGVTGAEVPAALATMDAYVSSIDDERYADTFALFSPDSRVVQNGLQAWLDQQRPREITGAEITSVRAGQDGDVQVVMTFTSRQAAADGPGGDQACTEWEQSYVLTGPERLIRSSETFTSRACPS